MIDQQLATQITISLAHPDSEDDAEVRGALTRIMREFGLAQALVLGILEMVPDPSLWRLTIGDIGQTVNEPT